MGDIRGERLLIGVELVHEAQSKRPFPRDWNVTNTLILMAQENGLLLYPAQAGIDGMFGDAFIISPPLSITIAELDDLMGRLEGTLERLSLYLQDQSGKE